MIAQVWTISVAIFAPRFIARPLTEGDGNETAAEKRNENREEDDKENEPRKA
ncbi:MAG TPA: hypothetical protein VJX69_05660 [Terriglobales bacterium]|nr:hypothetical protein [Terriglobales bacterium]